VEPYLLQTDIVQAEAVLIQRSKVAIEIVGVGVNGTDRGRKLRCQDIEPELGQPLVGSHRILLWEHPATTPVTNFLSKPILCEML
jgi:hypothetical protein